jgi:ubiquitin thioesterase CYLD
MKQKKPHLNNTLLYTPLGFSSVFDCLLYRPPNTQDIDEYCEVQRVLREEIVNPLRKNWFVRADRVMKLRQLLDSLTSVKGLMSEEKGMYKTFF